MRMERTASRTARGSQQPRLDPRLAELCAMKVRCLVISDLAYIARPQPHRWHATIAVATCPPGKTEADRNSTFDPEKNAEKRKDRVRGVQAHTHNVHRCRFCRQRDDANVNGARIDSNAVFCSLPQLATQIAFSSTVTSHTRQESSSKSRSEQWRTGPAIATCGTGRTGQTTQTLHRRRHNDEVPPAPAAAPAARIAFHTRLRPKRLVQVHVVAGAFRPTAATHAADSSRWKPSPRQSGSRPQSSDTKLPTPAIAPIQARATTPQKRPRPIRIPTADLYLTEEWHG